MTNFHSKNWNKFRCVKSASPIFISFLLSIITLCSSAQTEGVSISTNAAPADGSAMLDISSDSKGVLIPRLTTVQRDDIEDPAFGLMIMNTTTGCMNIWFGTSWKQLCGDCDFSNPVPGNNGPLCEGQTLNLSATTISGATYQWTGPDNFSSVQQNPSISNASTAESGTYSVTATLNGCTSAPQSTAVTVNSTPATPVASASNEGANCVGETIILSSSAVSGAGYSWSGPNGFSDNSQNTSLTNAQVSQSGTYSVIASISGCTSIAGSVSITVTAIPATPGTISGTSAGGENTAGNVYSISAVSGATSYVWTVPSGASITSANPSASTSITVTFGTESGDVTVSAVNTCGTSAASTKSVSVQPFAMGGTETIVDGYKYHTFTSSGSLVIGATGTVEVLVVAGGGGGSSGSSQGSGGGAGGLWHSTSYSVTPNNYPVTVGDGGLGSTTSTPTKGTNSQFGTLIADGGGAGVIGSDSNINGGCGGSPYSGSTGGLATKAPLQGGGYDGAPFGSSSGGGGGGGTAGTGVQGQSTIGGAGGPGTLIWGNYYGGGGGGGAGSGSFGQGGIGGGGNGALTNTPANNGTPNTGGGGGGCGGNTSGGNGGSGIVIVRYPI